MDYSYRGKHPPAKLVALASGPHFQSNGCWMADFGAIDHIKSNIKHLLLQQTYIRAVSIVNGQCLPIAHIGNNNLLTSSCDIRMNTILHFPHIAWSLLSIQKLCLDNNGGCLMHMMSITFRIRSTGKILAVFPLVILECYFVPHSYQSFLSYIF